MLLRPPAFAATLSPVFPLAADVSFRAAGEQDPGLPSSRIANDSTTTL
jgi:hypothetical protein